jgi:tetratricopeptide (TPR) repeat protein
MADSSESSPRRPALTELWRAELVRGLRRLAAGDAAGAELFFERAHRAEPERAEVCFALGRERMRQERLPEAEALLRVAWRAGMPAAAAALARCLGIVDTGGIRRAEAHAVLDEALARHPDEPGLLAVRAELLIDDGGDMAAAQNLLERAQAILASDGRDVPATRAAVAGVLAKALNLEGIRLARAGDSDAALFAFKRAFDLAPRWASPLVNMGAVFADLGRSARARSCYERALVLDDENPIARYNLALLLRARGDLLRAESELRQVLAIDPDYPGATRALADVLEARATQPPHRQA